MRVTKEFRASSADGTEYRVVCWQGEIDTSSTYQQRSSRLGPREYRLADGRALNCIDEDTFKIVATGETVQRRPGPT
jgi:hypothetical protein